MREAVEIVRVEMHWVPLQVTGKKLDVPYCGIPLTLKEGESGVPVNVAVIVWVTLRPWTIEVFPLESEKSDATGLITFSREVSTLQPSGIAL